MAPTKSKENKIVPMSDRRVSLERQAFELSKFCPVDRTNPVDCPLLELRPMRARERRAWIHRLTDDELEYLATYHCCCVAEKRATPKR